MTLLVTLLSALSTTIRLRGGGLLGGGLLGDGFLGGGLLGAGDLPGDGLGGGLPSLLAAWSMALAGCPDPSEELALREILDAKVVLSEWKGGMKEGF